MNLLFQYTMKYIKPLLKIQLGVFILVLINLGMNLSQPLLIKKIIDAYQSETLVMSSISLLYITFFVLLLLEFLTSIIRDKFINKARGVLQFKLRNDIYSKSLKIAKPYSSGKIISSIYQDVDAVVGLFNVAIVCIIADFILILFTMGILFTLNWKLATLSICMICIYLLLFYLSRKKIYNLNMVYKEQIGEMTETLQTGINQKFLSIKFNRQKHSCAMFSREQSKVVRLSMKLFDQQTFLFNCSNFFVNFFPLLLLLFGGYILMKGDITLGTLIAFSTYIVKLLQPVSRLTQINVAVQSALSSANRILAFLELDEKWKGTYKLNTLQSKISFSDVSYSYSTNNVVLDSISFEILKNDMVAIVGKSGAGKSTILKLLTKEISPVSGLVEYDGHNLENIGRNSFYNKISIVNQEEQLLPATIYENIAYGSKNATREDIERVSKEVGLHEFIISLPSGYDTFVTPVSMDLSVGQKQRIAIARALIHQAEILIFDEMTSAVDAYTESTILELLKKMKGRFTIILIAHKFQNVIFADNILVLDQGSIIEEGNHIQLMEQNGLYSQFYKKQRTNLIV